jgi:hypothetical protein
LAVREDIGAITGWEDVLKSNNRVALTERQPFFAYLLMGLTYGLSGTWIPAPPWTICRSYSRKGGWT